MTLTEEERFKKYSLRVLLGTPSDSSDGERHPYHNMKLKEPMFDAMCYAYGYLDYPSANRAYEEPAENFKEQVANIKKNQTREPKLVLDIGAGRGELTAAFLHDGVKCIAVDPSAGSKDIIPMTLKNWIDESSVAYFRNEPYIETIRTAYIMHLPIDTIIFCESIEHILEDEFNEALPMVEEILSKNRGYLIITNWIGFHPIYPDSSGWDHIREINDGVYNMLVKQTNTKIYQRGSHLVIAY